MTDFEFFVSFGIYLLWAIRLCQKIGYFESYDVQFLHFTAKNGTISSKFPVHKNENVKILCRTGGWDFMKLHFGYLMVCTKMWYGYFLSRWTLGIAPSLNASCNGQDMKCEITAWLSSPKYIFSSRERSFVQSRFGNIFPLTRPHYNNTIINSLMFAIWPKHLNKKGKSFLKYWQ